MEFVLTIIEIVIALALIGAILISSKGTGLSSAFGGEEFFYKSKRGFEKLLLYATIFLTFVFVLNSLILFAI